MLIVNDNIVFRFPKYEKEGIQKTSNRNTVTRENKDPHYASNSQSKLSRVSNEVPGKVFAGYEMMKETRFGKMFFTEINDEKQLQKLAYTLARFLKELHEIPLSTFEGIMQCDSTDSIQK